MVAEATAVGLAAAGGSLATILLTRLRCLVTNERCGCGYTDKSLFATNDTELRVTRVNGVDLAYVHHGGAFAEDETGSEADDDEA